MSKYIIKNKNFVSKFKETPDDVVIPSNLIAEQRVEISLFNGKPKTISNYGISINDVISKAIKEGRVSLPGPYTGDTEAAENGVKIGGMYILSQVNDYDMPSPSNRTIVIRIS